MLPLHPSSSYFSLGTGHCITFWMHLQNIFCNLDPFHLQWRTASRASLAMLSSSSSVMVSLVTVTCLLFRRSLSLFFIRLETCLVILTICILTGRMFGALLSVYDCCGWSWWPHIYNLAPPPTPLHRSPDTPALVTGQNTPLLSKLITAVLNECLIFKN